MNQILRIPAGLLLGAVLLTGCRDTRDQPELTAADSLSLAIDGEAFRRHVAVLASDSLEGRMPFTNGEAKTIAYLSEQFSELGLEPGNGDSFFQEVPLVGINSVPQGSLAFTAPGKSLELKYPDDFVAVSRRAVPEVALRNSELVFAGFGINAPEFDWNDYEGLDVRGKTVLVLVNDPGFADSTLFRGKNMTYYGRWTYKYEEAARQGAAGVLIIHETAPASYGWNVVKGGWSQPRLYLAAGDNNLSRAAAEGWITRDAAGRLFDLAGLSADLMAEAGKRGFKAVPMHLRTAVTLRNTISRSVSHNVIARWPGTDRADECIIYTAHWDHFGIGEKVNGDSVYNGAADNASGTAALLEIARAFARAPEKPLRSVVFLAVTAEEQGLLGSEYYASHPVYPVDKTVANINVDVLQPFGRMKDVIVVGKGQSELDEYVEAAARKQDRYTRGEPDPSGGFYFRSDHFNFAKAGIPALYIENGSDSREHGEAWGKARKDEYNSQRYHSPADEYTPDWDISGIVEDMRLIFAVGYRLSTENTFPAWKQGSEFKAIREKQVSKPGN